MFELIRQKETPVTAGLAWEYRQRTTNSFQTIPMPGTPVDPAIKPPMFKIYRGGSRFNLSYPLPDRLAPGPAWESLSSLLHYTLGLNQLRASPEQTALYGPPVDTEGFIAEAIRRNVPSGGAIYPGEIYLWLNRGWPQPAGFYHYDPAHHQLAQLRPGDFQAELASALVWPVAQLDQVEALVFLALRLTKTLHKYGDFSYRLQALDGGVVQGRLLTLAERLGWQAHLKGCYLDQSLNRWLGLDGEEESVYQVICLTRPATTFTPAASPANLTPPLNPAPLSLTYNANPAALQLPATLSKLHRAACYDTPAQVLATRPGPVIPAPRPEWPEFDMVEAIRQRYSESHAFEAAQLKAEELLKLARAGQQAAYWLSQSDSPVDLRLYFLALNVADLAQGSYCYDPAGDKLELVQPVPHAHAALMRANYFTPGFNFYHIGAVFYAVGNYQEVLGRYGARGFRLLNLAAGSALEMVGTAASGRGLHSAVYLGYTMTSTNQLLGLGEGQDSLVQLFIGRARPDFPFYQGYI
jgi:SagB-type dehydrogenase family enzyme